MTNDELVQSDSKEVSKILAVSRMRDLIDWFETGSIDAKYLDTALRCNLRVLLKLEK